MEKLHKRSGYIKVADQFMLDELLSSIFVCKLLNIHIIELNRILNRLRRTNYISKAQRNYLTELYINIVLNNETFRPETKKVKKQKAEHVNMLLIVQK